MFVLASTVKGTSTRMILIFYDFSATKHQV